MADKTKPDFLHSFKSAAVLFGLAAVAGICIFAPAVGLGVAAGFFAKQALIGFVASQVTEGLAGTGGGIVNWLSGGHWRGFEGDRNRLAIFSAKMVTYVTVMACAALVLPMHWVAMPTQLVEQLAIGSLLANGAMCMSGWCTTVIEKFGSLGRGLKNIGGMMAQPFENRRTAKVDMSYAPQAVINALPEKGALQGNFGTSGARHAVPYYMCAPSSADNLAFAASPRQEPSRLQQRY